MNSASIDVAVAGVAVGLFARAQPESGDLPVGWLLALGALALICGMAYWQAARIRHKRRQHSHEYLFADLCDLHRLNRSARNLLKQLARHYNLAHPGRMFLEPVWLDPQRLPPVLDGRSEDVAKLRSALFGPDPHPTDK